jgi:hypothetical protein
MRRVSSLSWKKVSSNSKGRPDPDQDAVAVAVPKPASAAAPALARGRRERNQRRIVLLAAGTERADRRLGVAQHHLVDQALHVGQMAHRQAHARSAKRVGLPPRSWFQAT